MSEPKVRLRRLSELPRDIPPPHDGWAALEARLRAGGMPRDSGAQPRSAPEPRRPWRTRAMGIATLAAVFAAVVVGISIDRWILSPLHPTPPVVAARDNSNAQGRFRVAYVTDPRYLHERAELLRSLNASLSRLPPPTRKKVLQSLATIHQSIQQIQQALGREPGNALLQELLIDTYQDEMQVLSTVQEVSGGSGET
ncbi:MAG: hypothetical protein ACREV7_05320 [Steroidobacteraceae bacterium]